MARLDDLMSNDWDKLEADPDLASELMANIQHDADYSDLLNPLVQIDTLIEQLGAFSSATHEIRKKASNFASSQYIIELYACLERMEAGVEYLLQVISQIRPRMEKRYNLYREQIDSAVRDLLSPMLNAETPEEFVKGGRASMRNVSDLQEDKGFRDAFMRTIYGDDADMIVKEDEEFQTTINTNQLNQIVKDYQRIAEILKKLESEEIDDSYNEDSEI